MLIPETVMGLHKIADGESTRYALGGVRLERDADGKCWAVATDGRRLVAFTWEEDSQSALGDNKPVPGFEAIVPMQLCERVQKLRQDSSPLRSVLLDEGKSNGQLTLLTADRGMTFAIESHTLEGAYPKWRDVTVERAAEDEVRILIDPTLLSEMLRAIRSHATLDEKRQVELRIARTQTDKRPLFIVAEVEGRRAVGVLMPIADDTPPVEPPSPPPTKAVKRPEPTKKNRRKAKA